MSKVNSFVKTHLNKIYMGIFLVFWILILTACEKEPITPYEPPSAVDPTDIAGTWNIRRRV